jgi:Carboxypeptidase regulatory-like domain
MRAIATAIMVVLVLVILPVPSFGQALGTISGVAKDSSGAILPGVTVEAASPALIEKVRTAVTNGAGQYSIVNLPPGVYTVTFGLAGFSTYQRGGVEVAINFTATVDGEMRVGSVSETITVTGASPIVDVKSAAQTRSVTAEIIKELPGGGSWIQMAASVPAIRPSVTDVGGVLGDQTGASVSAHGSANMDGVSLMDGLRIGNMYLSSNLTNMSLSPLLFDQVDVQLSGQSAETGTNGVIMNAIPRSGGNTFSGSALANGSAPSLQGNNITDRLLGRGVANASTTLKKLYDINGSIGGPIVRDRLWFYATSRYFTNEYYLAGLNYAVDPSAIVRVNDLGNQGFAGTYTYDNNGRVTWGITDKQKVTGWYAYQYKVDPHWAIAANTNGPEAVRVTTWHTQLSTFKWTYTATNRLLFEAGVGPGASPDTIIAEPDRINGISIQDQGSPVGSTLGIRPLIYRTPQGFDFDDRLPSQSFVAAMNYVTGSHTVKVGMDMQRGHFWRGDNNESTGGIWYRTREYAPNLVTIQAPNAGWQNNLNHNLGIYAQDRWTMDRLTLSGGLRLDLQNESTSDFTSQPHQWLPNRNDFYPAVKNVPNWKDVNPRVAAAYDVFGNGKTAVRASASRAVEQDSIRYAVANNPANTLVTQVSRVWTDSNVNFVPDCNLLNSQPNGECQVWQDLGFGSARPSTFYDAAILNGWGVRPWNWEFSTGVQHEIMPRLSASVGYFRRVYGNFNVVDNEALTKSDFTQFSVVAPTDPRLPTSGQTITGLFDQNRSVANRNVVKDAAQFGKQISHWNGVDLTIDTRLGNGLLLQGGASWGKSLSDNCDIVDDVPEALTGAVVPAGLQAGWIVGVVTPGIGGGQGALSPAQFCHQETPFLALYKAVASYTIPWDIRLSGTFQSVPGPQIAANQIYAGTAPGLGRPFTFGQATVNVAEPGVMWGDRLNQFDLRFSKIVRFGSNRLDLNVDLYNAFNSDAILTQQNTYGATWQNALSVIQPRFVKFGARLDF